MGRRTAAVIFACIALVACFASVAAQHGGSHFLELTFFGVFVLSGRDAVHAFANS